MIKFCNKCQKNEEFTATASMCKRCNKEYQRQHYLNNKSLYNERNKQRKKELRMEISSYKESHPCVGCKNLWPAPVMDFHHLGNKDLAINAMISQRSRKAIFEEIDKCILLCANCHRLHHAGLLELTT